MIETKTRPVNAVPINRLPIDTFKDKFPIRDIIKDIKLRNQRDDVFWAVKLNLLALFNLEERDVGAAVNQYATICNLALAGLPTVCGATALCRRAVTSYFELIGEADVFQQVVLEIHTHICIDGGRTLFHGKIETHRSTKGGRLVVVSHCTLLVQAHILKAALNLDEVASTSTFIPFVIAIILRACAPSSGTKGFAHADGQFHDRTYTSRRGTGSRGTVQKVLPTVRCPFLSLPGTEVIGNGFGRLKNRLPVHIGHHRHYPITAATSQAAVRALSELQLSSSEVFSL